MAEDNQDQAREMAEEGLEEGQKRCRKAGEGRELIEEAKRLDHDAVAGIAPESEDADRDDPTAIQPETLKQDQRRVHNNALLEQHPPSRRACNTACY